MKQDAQEQACSRQHKHRYLERDRRRRDRQSGNSRELHSKQPYHPDSGDEPKAFLIKPGIVLSLKNQSGVSYDIGDATFVVESKNKGKRSVIFDRTLFQRSRFGSLSAAPRQTARIACSFDKMTLSDAQVLNIYFYEAGGMWNLRLTVDTRDINRVTKPL